MALTGRQTDFLRQFVTLYNETHEPLHYAEVAGHLGVSKISAYDMLRVLDKLGMVSSEYVLRGKGGGAGRSSIVFRPSAQASALVREPSVCIESHDDATWGNRLSDALGGLDNATAQEIREQLDDILNRLPGLQTPIIYAAETTLALLLGLRLLALDQTAGIAPFETLRAMGPLGEAGLGVLSGLAIGLAHAKGINRQVTNRLVAAQERYVASLASLDAYTRQRLAEYADQIAQLLEK